jgi:hypothetical protein
LIRTYPFQLGVGAALINLISNKLQSRPKTEPMDGAQQYSHPLTQKNEFKWHKLFQSKGKKPFVQLVEILNG